MKRFLKAWKKSENSGSSSDYYADSLLYPVAFNRVAETEKQRTARQQEMTELRTLTMEKD